MRSSIVHFLGEGERSPCNLRLFSSREEEGGNLSPSTYLPSEEREEETDRAGRQNAIVGKEEKKKEQTVEPFSRANICYSLSGGEGGKGFAW